LKFAWSLRVLFAVGIAATLLLVITAGVRPTFALLSSAGWILLLLVPLHVLPLLLDVMGWRLFLVPRVPLPMLFYVATIREAVNRLLPVANVGGEIVGVQVLTRLGVDGTRAAASIVVETLVNLFAQLLFVGLGILCMADLSGVRSLPTELAAALAISLPLLALLYWLLHYGSAFERLGRIAARVLGNGSRASGAMHLGASLDLAIRRILLERRVLVAALCWQFIGLVAGSAETWFALRWLGCPQGILTALALESLIQAVRHFVFVVPAGLGVQEAGLMAIGALLGIPSDVAVALSLAKRMREILFGVPVLCAWQWQARGGISARIKTDS
jgi:putative membrane protein